MEIMFGVGNLVYDTCEFNVLFSNVEQLYWSNIKPPSSYVQTDNKLQPIQTTDYQLSYKY